VADSAALIAQLRAQLEGAMGENKALRETITRLEESKASIETELEDAHAQLNEMAKTRPLRYSDIYDGLLAKHVGAFTYFPTSTQNDAFLLCINSKPRGLDDPGVTFFVRIRFELSATNPALSPTAVSELILSGCTHDMRGWRAF
jgi:hypothetical protein